MPQTGFACPECGRVFEQSKGLGAHRYRKHGIRGASATVVNRRRRDGLVPGEEIPDEFAAELEALSAPLRAEVDRLRARLQELDLERHGIATRLSRLDGALKRLMPEPAEPRKTLAKAGTSEIRYPATEEQTQEVLRFIEANFNGDGFTETEVARAMFQTVSYGEGKIKSAVRQLHDRGLIRLDRVVKGGGKSYKLIGESNGASAT